IGTRRAAGNRRRQIARRAVVRREVLGSGRPGGGDRIADAVRVGRRADSRHSGGINSADARAPVGIAPGIKDGHLGTAGAGPRLPLTAYRVPLVLCRSFSATAPMSVTIFAYARVTAARPL